MAIKVTDLLPQPSYITIGASKVEVKPLTLEQIIKLLSVYRYDLIVMFSDTAEGNLNLITLVMTAPRMVADIIAYGIDADGQQEDIIKLPAVSQVELLAEIWKVSVPEPKKLMSLLSQVMAGLQQVGISPSLQNEDTTPQNTEVPAPPVEAPALPVADSTTT